MGPLVSQQKQTSCEISVTYITAYSANALVEQVLMPIRFFFGGEGRGLAFPSAFMVLILLNAPKEDGNPA